MRVLAARFPNRERASLALGRLHRRFRLGPLDVGIAPLGIPGERSESETVLAGRFPENRMAEVGRVVREAGGEIVADVDESRTRPRQAAPRDADSRRVPVSHSTGSDHPPLIGRH
jgi:hypothetical protein